MIDETANQDGTVRHDETASRRRHASLAGYLTSATLVRSASGGAPVGLVSLALARDGHGGAVLGGLLAALLTAPNVAGPWLARWLESVRDKRRLLAGGFAGYGLALAGGSLLIGHAPTVLVALIITTGGLAAPLMTGGLSSRLALIVGGDSRTQRRAEGFDATTYGVSNIAGPAAVAALATATGPLDAMVALGGAAVLSGLLLLLLLPAEQTASSAAGAAMTVRETLKVAVGLGPLRRVMVATTLTSVSTGGVMVIAVVFGGQLHHAAGAGAALGAAYGVSNLLGGLFVGAFPLTGEPERLTVRLIAANAVSIAVCAAAPDYLAALVTFALAGATSAMLFTATLTVRSVYSPPTARAHIFVTMAGFKMAAASAGTALAGTLVGIGPRLALLVGSAVVATAVVAAITDRHLSRDASPVRDRAARPGPPENPPTAPRDRDGVERRPGRTG